MRALDKVSKSVFSGRVSLETVACLGTALAIAAFTHSALSFPLDVAPATNALSGGIGAIQAINETPPLDLEFARDVFPKLLVPVDEVEAYATRLSAALVGVDVSQTAIQFIVLVDHNPNVQAALLSFTRNPLYELLSARQAPNDGSTVANQVSEEREIRIVSAARHR